MSDEQVERVLSEHVPERRVYAEIAPVVCCSCSPESPSLWVPWTPAHVAQALRDAMGGSR